MKVLIVCLLFSCSSFFINKPEKEYYDNGNIKYKVYKINNKLDGLAKYWDEDGNLVNEVFYLNGELHGDWIEYFSNKNKKCIIHYNFGRKNGYEIWYYINGQKKSQTKYKENKVIVETIRWDKNGELIYR